MNTIAKIVYFPQSTKCFLKNATKIVVILGICRNSPTPSQQVGEESG